MKNKIGIIFTGISYDEGKHTRQFDHPYDPMCGRPRYSRSFLKTYKNHFDKIINPLKIENDVSIFLTTYESDKIELLKEVYKPELLTILKGYNHTFRTTYIRSISEIINKCPDLDFYICTRFDIEFYDAFTNWNFDFNKFNFIFIEKFFSKMKVHTCDVLFALPNKFLISFYNALIAANSNSPGEGYADLHYLYEFIANEIGKENIHFISEEEQSSLGANFRNHNENSFFYLCRDEIRLHDN